MRRWKKNILEREAREGKNVSTRRRFNSVLEAAGRRKKKKKRRKPVCCLDKDNKPAPTVSEVSYFTQASHHLSQARISSDPLPHVKRAKRILYKANPCWLDSRALWIEIQEQVARMYEAHNRDTIDAFVRGSQEAAAPPVVYVIQHQHAVHLWRQLMKDQFKMLPVLHVDSHPDMNAIPYPYHKCHEIGAVLPCALREGLTDTLAWVMPKWVQEHEHTGHWHGAMVHCDKRKGPCTPNDTMVEWENICKRPKQYFLATNASEDTASSDFHVYSTSIKGVPGCARGAETIPFRYAHVAPRASPKLASYLGSRYILDIDLDFFVTNGYEQGKLDYDEFDLPSHLRVLDGPTEQGSSRLHDDDTSATVAEALRKEVSAIKRRVKSFAAFIRGLQKRGSRPVIVSISDSAPVNFTSVYGSLNPFENCYCPRYFVPLLHDLLRLHLGEVFAHGLDDS